MKHFLHYVENAIKKNWERPGISNYGAKTYTCGEIAANVLKMHILFENRKKKQYSLWYELNIVNE